jgi:hypothetical protein
VEKGDYLHGPNAFRIRHPLREEKRETSDRLRNKIDTSAISFKPLNEFLHHPHT